MSKLLAAVARLNREARGAYMFNMTGKPHLMLCSENFGHVSTRLWPFDGRACIDVYHDVQRDEDAMAARKWAGNLSGCWLEWHESFQPKPHIRPRVITVNRKGERLKHPQMRFETSKRVPLARWRKGKARTWAKWKEDTQKRSNQ